MKTNSSAKKRFKLTGTGKIARKSAFKRHILTKKTTKQKRGLSGTAYQDMLIHSPNNQYMILGE